MIYTRLRPISSLLLALLWLLSAKVSAFGTATDQDGNLYVSVSDGKGDQSWVRDDRQPSLYTADWGQCVNSGDIDITRFDAAFYKDNMTVIFHLGGTTKLKNDNLMMYLTIFAYGEMKYDLLFNPCNANIATLCPAREDVPFEASGLIPLAPTDIASIPSLAFSIPDFEGQATMRIFSNSTQAQIGCYSARITNGKSFGHPKSLGAVLGIFVGIAIIASGATAIYGDAVSEMRKHYAHSMSVLVVFAVFHHIYFTGALSLNWPSNVVAFWSNYAWSAGMIYSQSMQQSISQLVGSKVSNTTLTGAADSASDNMHLGGGYDINNIYWDPKDPPPVMARRDQLLSDAVTASKNLWKRSGEAMFTDYRWYGEKISPGMPLPGNYSGFAGLLSAEDIPASNAFMTVFLWLLVLIACIIGSFVGLKWISELLIHFGRIRQDRLETFRRSWIGFTTLAVLRTFVIAFFASIFFCLFQFSYGGSRGTLAIATLSFLVIFVGMSGFAGYACYRRLQFGNFISEPDRIYIERTRILWLLPFFRLRRESSGLDSEKCYAGSLPCWRIFHIDAEAQLSVHDDEAYIKQYGWLAARFRRTRWWFFSVWLVYEFVRACIYAGGIGNAISQVASLLVVEVFAFIAIIRIRPFEGQRVNAIVVYMLSLSKVLTLCLSAAFDARFNIARITTSAIGIFLIVVHASLTLVLLVAIILGAASSWMSLKRHRSREDFRPRKWTGLRERYFEHIDFAAKDVPRPAPAPKDIEPEPESPKQPYFSVNAVRRVDKIEDEDGSIGYLADAINASALCERPHLMDMAADAGFGLDGLPQRPSLCSFGSNDPTLYRRSAPATPQFEKFTPPFATSDRVQSRRSSIHSTHSFASPNVPFGAHVHRQSWSSNDFANHIDVLSQRFWQNGSAAVSISSRRNSIGGSVPAVVTDRRPVTTGNDQRSASTGRKARPGDNETVQFSSADRTLSHIETQLNSIFQPTWNLSPPPPPAHLQPFFTPSSSATPSTTISRPPPPTTTTKRSVSMDSTRSGRPPMIPCLTDTSSSESSSSASTTYYQPRSRQNSFSSSSRSPARPHWHQRRHEPFAPHANARHSSHNRSHDRSHSTSHSRSRSRGRRSLPATPDASVPPTLAPSYSRPTPSPLLPPSSLPYAGPGRMRCRSDGSTMTTGAMSAVSGESGSGDGGSSKSLRRMRRFEL